MGEQLIYKKVLDFNEEQCKNIALKYANTNYNYASSAIASECSRDGEYAVLPKTIMKIVQKAIRKAFVSEAVAKKIREKATHNAYIYGGKHSADKTYDLYTSLIIKRREFLENGGKTPKRKKENTTPNTSINFDEKVKNELKNLENSLKQVNFKIDTFEEFNEEEITLDSLLSEKTKLEEKIRKHKYYHGMK